jgi:hypothetical protein
MLRMITPLIGSKTSGVNKQNIRVLKDPLLIIVELMIEVANTGLCTVDAGF